MAEIREQLITDVDAREFFHGAIQAAIDNQQLKVADETVVYLGNLLTSFINSDRLYDQTPDGVMIRPLAWYYQEALEARTSNEKTVALRRLGDISLFISGLYAQSLSRSLVDVDYYISMGGNAYGFLSDSGTRTVTLGLKEVFQELSRKFTELIDVLSEVGESTHISTNNDVLRLYEIWLKSGSRRAAGKLRQFGIQPVPAGARRH